MLNNYFSWITKISLYIKVNCIQKINKKKNDKDHIEEQWELMGNFGESGFFSQSPQAVHIGACKNKLYVVDSSGQIWKYDDAKFTQVSLDNNISVKKVYVREDRECIIDDKGQVYFRGNNTKGQCGLGTRISKNNEFIKIPEKLFDSRVEDVALGLEHSLFRTEHGRIYSCGSNQT
eukprot:UN33950